MLRRDARGWTLERDGGGDYAAQVGIPEDLAWRIFTKGIDRASARKQVEIRGDLDLGAKVLELTAVVG